MCKTWPIIVTYRRPALLRISLMRLAQQNLDIAEVVVVDNSPADDTRATSLSDLCVPWMIKELPRIPIWDLLVGTPWAWNTFLNEQGYMTSSCYWMTMTHYQIQIYLVQCKEDYEVLK